MEDTDGERREPLLSVRQAAALLGLCTATVYEHCAKGNLRHVKVASAIRIASSALREFVELRSLPREPGRRPMPSLAAASLPSGRDETPDLREGGPSGEEVPMHTEATDEDAWYQPE
jgi:excisionase family DNA binding protein